MTYFTLSNFARIIIYFLPEFSIYTQRLTQKVGCFHIPSHPHQERRRMLAKILVKFQEFDNYYHCFALSGKLLVNVHETKRHSKWPCCGRQTLPPFWFFFLSTKSYLFVLLTDLFEIIGEILHVASYNSPHHVVGHSPERYFENR